MVLTMATLPSSRALYKYKLVKYYLRCYISPCEKYFCSNVTKNEKKSNEIKKEEKSVEENLNERYPSEHCNLQKLGEIVKTKSSEGSTKENAKKKLFSLLTELKMSPGTSKIKPDLVLAKPLKRPTKKERFQHLEKDNISPEEKMKLAVKAVAENVKGDPKKTLMELNEKLSVLNLSQELSVSNDKVGTESIGIDEKLQENLMSSVKDIASTVTTPVKSKLTQRLLKLSVEKKGDPQEKISIENMMKGIKLEKRDIRVDSKRMDSDWKRRARDEDLEESAISAKRIIQRPRVQSKVNIFQSAPLDIFSLDTDSKVESKKSIWESLEEKRLKLLVEFAPANAFEEMIMWTEQGKHWKFPINNEIDYGAEENVGFNEHVFLEQHLHGFPTRGPVRHFIELVAVGLSKNPYISVERKIENINWFRDYFKEKEDILKEYGAIN